MTELTPAEKYELVCDCGQTAAGPRGRQPGFVPCGRCGRKLFAFPIWPAPVQLVLAPTPPRRSPGRAEFWLAPAAGATAALVLVAGLVAIIVTNRPPPPPRASLSHASARGRADDITSSLRQLFSSGSYSVARGRIAELIDLQKGHPDSFAADEVARARRWLRQVDLLADLSSESLDEIVGRAVELSEEEWAIVFAARYAGRGVVFDAPADAPSAGAPRIDYSGRYGGVTVTPDAASIALLHLLPLRGPRRILVGARIAAVRRVGPGNWKVAFQPDSGVLFTDPDVLLGLSYGVDAELLEVLQRQRGWADELGR